MAAHITTTVNGVRAGHNIEIDSALRHSRGTGFTISTLTQEMVVYADPGTAVRVSMERNPAGEGINVFVTISGYLLDR